MLYHMLCCVALMSVLFCVALSSCSLPCCTSAFPIDSSFHFPLYPGIITAIAWPVALLQLGYLIDNPWNVCARRAAQVGKHLADVLLTRPQVGLIYLFIYLQMFYASNVNKVFYKAS